MVTHITRIEDLANAVVHDLSGRTRIIISVAGVPGAGKSTLVENVMGELGKRGVVAKTLPQDGYHYHRKELEEFDDPKEAFRRRGAPFTFNAKKFVDTVRKLRTGSTVVAPLFDHSEKDPQEELIRIDPDVKVVFVEGNYVGLKDKPWCELADTTDCLWLIQQDSRVVRERLIQRHLSSGVSSSLQEAEERCDGLDWQNALYVMNNTRAPDVIVALD